MLQNDEPVRINDEPNVEEQIGPIRVLRFCFRDDKYVMFAGEEGESVGFGARDIDGAGPRVFGVIDIHDFVVEPLQGTLWDGNQTDRNVEVAEHDGGFGQMPETLQIFADVLAPAHAPEG